MTHFAVGMPGPFELIIILVIVLIFFGVGKLPRVLSQMGKGVRAFKDGMSGNPNADGDVEEIDITPDDPPAIAENPAPALEDAEEVAQPMLDETYGDTALDEPVAADAAPDEPVADPAPDEASMADTILDEAGDDGADEDDLG